MASGTAPSLVRAAEIFAICIRLSAPSIMRAPPDAETTITGSLRAAARSIARVIFSPTTTPMLPPMKRYSITQTMTVRPLSLKLRANDGILESGSLLRLGQALLVRALVDEVKGVRRAQVVVKGHPFRSSASIAKRASAST